MEGNKATEEQHSMHQEEFLRQISNQSALLAGFAFTGLTLDSGTTIITAKIWFVGCVSSCMALEILALVLSGFILSISRISNLNFLKWRRHTRFCVRLYLLGIVCFLTSLPFLVYLKVPQLTIPIAVLSFLIFLIMIFKFGRIQMEPYTRYASK